MGVIKATYFGFMSVVWDEEHLSASLGNNFYEDLTYTRIHFTPLHWLLCHMGLY